jgi:Restriction endonuclease BglII
MSLALLPSTLAEKFEIFDWRNAAALLAAVHGQEFDDVVSILSDFVLPKSWIEHGGGNKSEIAKYVDRMLGERGWVEKSFDTRILVDGVQQVSPTHAVDCYKNRVALEVEWNNKDPFFDRDLNNFRLLYDLQIIDLGVIITRATSLEVILKASGRSVTTFGKATTHTEKLYPKIKGGGAGGCPVLVFGITPGAYRDDQ